MEASTPPLTQDALTNPNIHMYTAHHGAKQRKFNLSEGFGADVGNVVSGGYQLEDNGAVCDAFADEIVLDINVFGVAVVDEILGQ